MPYESVVKRYSAYYAGWCQAFGEHEADPGGEGRIRWLRADDRVGIIMSPELRKRFYRLVLGRHGEVPGVTVSPTAITVGEYVHALAPGPDRKGMQTLLAFLRGAGETHMFLSYHLYYPPGTRIVTFSRRRPLGLLYHEIPALRMRVLETDAASDETTASQ